MKNPITNDHVDIVYYAAEKIAEAKDMFAPSRDTVRLVLEAAYLVTEGFKAATRAAEAK